MRAREEDVQAREEEEGQGLVLRRSTRAPVPRSWGRRPAEEEEEEEGQGWQGFRRSTLAPVPQSRSNGGAVKEGGEEETETEETEEVEVRTSQSKGAFWHKICGKYMAQCKGKHLGYHTTEEKAAAAYNNYMEGGVVPVSHRDLTSTSQHVGVWWDKSIAKWRAMCKGKHLGYHVTEEGAVQAHDNYTRDGVVPVVRRDPSFTSQFKGVVWVKGTGKWQAQFKRKSLGYYVTEAAAAAAWAKYAEDGVDPIQLLRREGTSSSQYKGVSWNRSLGKWRAGAYTRPLFSST